MFVFAIVCILLVSNAAGDTYTFDWLVENSDYIIMADNSQPYQKTENHRYTSCTVSLPISEYYEKDGKYYLELDVECFHKRVLPKVITIVSDNKDIKLDKHHLYILFLNEIDAQEGFYTITNGKTGIIQIKSKKLKPYDRTLKKELNKRFEDSEIFLEWFYNNCENDVKRIEKESKIVVNPETTTAP